MSEVCKHHGHYRFTAKRLVDIGGLGCSDYVYFTVYSHYKKYSKAKSSSLCVRVFRAYHQIGKPEESGLTLVRPIGEKT
jgi:hypothetical protein